MSKRYFLRCIKSKIAEQPSPDVTQNTAEPFMQPHILNDLNNFHKNVYIETNNVDNILQPSKQLVDNPRITFNSNNYINNYVFRKKTRFISVTQG